MLNIYALQHQRKPRKLKLSPAVHKRHKKPGAKLHFHDYPPSRKKRMVKQQFMASVMLQQCAGAHHKRCWLA